MRFTETCVHGAFVVELDRHADERGFFARIWDPDELEEAGLPRALAQASISRSTRAGTLRGLHFQRAPHAEAKLVRCVGGSVFDVVLDLRPESPTYLDWHAVELTRDNGRALFIPKGCAHGFRTLEDDTEILYLISHAHVPSAASGVRWDDPAFAIVWPEAQSRILNDRDATWPDFEPVQRRR
jgi:dTDP-4-dehydrorhamnose 3,5-epimerase